MRRRRKNTFEGAFVLVALIVGGIGLAIAKAVDSIGGLTLLLICAAIIGGIAWSKHQKKQARLAYLRAKYADEQTVQRIMSRTYWQGQTEEQLRDSLGMPHSVDKNLLKTRKREVWKYHPTGVNRYRLRITLDDDVVVGFGHKDHGA